MKWTKIYADRGNADRNIALRNRPDLKPVEERMSIVSNRVQETDPNTNTTLRLESGLEASAVMIFKSDPSVVAIKAQHGPVRFMRDGKWHDHYFDLCVDYDTGCRVLYMVRHADAADDLAVDLELIRNHELHKHAHFAELLTENEITKPAVYRAEEIVTARKFNNRGNNELVLKRLKQKGGRARVFDILSTIPGLTFASGWNAVWRLMDLGLVEHDHRDAESVYLKTYSRIRIVEQADEAA